MVIFTLLLAAFTASAQDGPAIFAPLDQTRVTPGPLRIVARAPGTPELTLDGKPVPFTSPGPGALFAQINMPPGDHEIIVKSAGAEAKARIFAGSEHPSFKLFQTHPPGGVPCDTCHAVKNDTWALKRATLSPLCHSCHNLEKFVPTHTPHNTGTLVDCQNCHHPHGSAAKSHLRVEKNVACKTCHS